MSACYQRHDSKEWMVATRICHDITIDGDPVAVFQLLAEIDLWPALFPHVRSVRPLAGAGTSVSLFWHTIPLTLVCVQRATPETGQIEQRCAAGWGIWFSCRWTVRGASEHQTRVTAEVEALRGPWLVRKLVVQSVVDDFITQTLRMTRLLAESDRIAHQGVE